MRSDFVVMRAWQEIQTIEAWQEAYRRTDDVPLLLLKHSTRCPISKAAYRAFESFVDSTRQNRMIYALVLVIESRLVSDRIAQDLQAKHESPQIFLIRGRTVVWQATHWDITEEAIQKAVARLS